MNKIMYYDSSFELERMIFLDENENVYSFEKHHGIILEYSNDDGSTHKYIPDFLVKLISGEIFLEEIKGWINNNEIFNKKREAAIKYCENNGFKFRIIFKKGLKTLND